MTQLTGGVRPEGDTLPREHFASLAQLEDHYWWHQSRYQAALAALLAAGAGPTSSLADLGCGTGGFLRFLRQHGWQRLAGFDASPLARSATEAFGLAVSPLDLETPFVLPDSPWDALVAMDVLEHLGDELGFLRSAAAALAPGGLLFLTVPAFPHLFSRWDERLRHHRRYTRRHLLRAVGAAGLEPIAARYLFALVYPAALLRRWLGWHDGSASCEFPVVSPIVGRLLRGAARLEMALPRPGMPFGTSVTLVARRPRRG
jgi:SAM-dependent methyltransferase